MREGLENARDRAQRALATFGRRAARGAADGHAFPDQALLVGVDQIDADRALGHAHRVRPSMQERRTEIGAAVAVEPAPGQVGHGDDLAAFLDQRVEVDEEIRRGFVEHEAARFHLPADLGAHLRTEQGRVATRLQRDRIEEPEAAVLSEIRRGVAVDGDARAGGAGGEQQGRDGRGGEAEEGADSVHGTLRQDGGLPWRLLPQLRPRRTHSAHVQRPE